MSEDRGAYEATPPIVGSVLDGRYVLRRIVGQTELDWANALAIHGDLYHSPFSTAIEPDSKTEHGYTAAAQLRRRRKLHEELIRFPIENCDMSLGIFDTQYVYRRPESAKTGGKLYWDWDDAWKTEQELLEQMDFPLVGTLLAVDAEKPVPEATIKAWQAIKTLAPWYYGLLDAMQDRKGLGHASFPGEKLLQRCGTDVRNDYAGRGIMKATAYFYMDLARKRGWDRIEIDIAHPSVGRVWLSPPLPARAELVGVLDPKDYAAKGDQASEQEREFSKSQTTLSRIFVTLGS